MIRFQRGDTVVLRGLHQDGRIATAETGRVVSDDDRGLLTWVAQGSQCIRRVSLAGVPTRHMALSDKLELATIQSVTTWSGPDARDVLMLTPAESRHAVWWFFTSDGIFDGWYVNLQTRATRWWGGMDIRDHALDVLVAPDRSWRWKDEDEFAERTGHPLFWDEQGAQAIRAEGEQVIAAAAAGAFPFDGTLCDFRPDPSWPPTDLPWWWDQLPAGECGPDHAPAARPAPRERGR